MSEKRKWMKLQRLNCWPMVRKQSKFSDHRSVRIGNRVTAAINNSTFVVIVEEQQFVHMKRNESEQPNKWQIIAALWSMWRKHNNFLVSLGIRVIIIIAWSFGQVFTSTLQSFHLRLFKMFFYAFLFLEIQGEKRIFLYYPIIRYSTNRSLRYLNGKSEELYRKSRQPLLTAKRLLWFVRKVAQV